jgi:leader peptidase (prepilin peptidase)/N-methyltransferase
MDKLLTTMLYVISYILVFLTGISLGSFLNVLIYRLPRKISVAKGFSFCPACQHRLHAKDLIPILSYVAAKGKCRYCGKPVSIQYPIIEALTGIVALSCFLWLPIPQARVAFGCFCALIVIALVDASIQEIPDSMNLVIFLCGIIAIWGWPEIGIVPRLIGILCISLPLFLLSLLIDGAFGMGDVKLMAAAGFLLGWQHTLLAFFIALILGGVYGMSLLVLRKKGRKDHFAFGPALAVGIFAALLFGDRILAWYLTFF